MLEYYERKKKRLNFWFGLGKKIQAALQILKTKMILTGINYGGTRNGKLK